MLIQLGRGCGCCFGLGREGSKHDGEQRMRVDFIDAILFLL